MEDEGLMSSGNDFARASTDWRSIDSAPRGGEAATLAKVAALLRLVAETYDCEDEDFRGSGRLLLGEALKLASTPPCELSAPEGCR
jgi:hypothetical protein